jgi:hypothetical protein
VAHERSRDPFHFFWPVPRAGYHWVAGSDGPQRWLVKHPPAAPSRLPNRVTWPLRDEPNLFLTFAELGSSEEEILAFANQHGRLGLEIARDLHASLPVVGGRAVVVAELRKDWTRAIRRMRLACELSAAIAGNDRAVFRRSIHEESWGRGRFSDHAVRFEVPERPDAWLRVTPRDPEAQLLRRGDLRRAAQALLQHAANEALELHTSARVLLDDETERQGLYVTPKNLLGAMWVQFAQSIDSGGSSKRCGKCGNWMQLAPGTNRSDRDFCSDRCRVNAYRQRKKSAVALHRKGMASRVIAKKIGSDLETVRGWLGLAKDGE